VIEKPALLAGFSCFRRLDGIDCGVFQATNQLPALIAGGKPLRSHEDGKET
jgi:hypothetical protein